MGSDEKNKLIQEFTLEFYLVGYLCIGLYLVWIGGVNSLIKQPGMCSVWKHYAPACSDVQSAMAYVFNCYP